MLNTGDIYRPISRHFRLRRVRTFYELMSARPATRVLDVGGTSVFWDLAEQAGLPRIADITILNILPDHRRRKPPNTRWVVGDARDMQFADGEFDIVFSNSMIEHLGDAVSQKRCAAEIRRVGKSYWVQTPDPRFPIEPHYITPFVHWLPKRQRSAIARYGTLWGLLAKPSPQIIQKRIDEIRLIPLREFRSLFFDGEILIERFAGLPKSLIALRRPPVA